MSKSITAPELASVISSLLSGEQKHSLPPKAFQTFMTNLARVVCEHCDGSALFPAINTNGEWTIDIQAVGGVPPENGGIWRQFDPQGQIYFNDPAIKLGIFYGHEHPTYTLEHYGQDRARAAIPSSYFDYWGWVERQLLSCGAMPAERNITIFEELLQAEQLNQVHCGAAPRLVQPALCAQELLAELPMRAVFAADLFELRPDLMIAFKTLDPDFKLNDWLGMSVQQFAGEFGKPFDADIDPIVDLGPRGHVTMQAIWDAQRLAQRTWKLHAGDIIVCDKENLSDEVRLANAKHLLAHISAERNSLLELDDNKKQFDSLAVAANTQARTQLRDDLLKYGPRVSR